MDSHDSQRIKNEDLKIRLAEIGYDWIDGDYKNTLSKITVVDKYGFKYVSTWQHIKNRRDTLKDVHVSNPYSIHNIHIWLEINLPHLKLLSEEYITTRKPLKLLCTLCGNEFESPWTKISNLNGGKKCPICSNRIPHTHEKVINIASKLNPEIEFLKATKENGKDWVVDCKCKKCKRKWSTKLYTIQRGNGCWDCNRGHGNGGYNITRAERHKDKWLNKPSLVYIIKIKNGNEEFIKIGITSASVDYRFKNKYNFPYDIEVLDEIKSNLYDSIYIENHLHALLSSYTYTPLAKFDGYTECFNIEALPLVQDYLLTNGGTHAKLDSNRRSNI